MTIESISAAGFDRDVLHGDRPSAVAFVARWCGPCRYSLPIVETLASRWVDRIRFFRVDVDDDPDLVQEFRVFSIPTIALFADGRACAWSVGAKPASIVEADLGLRRYVPVAQTAPFSATRLLGRSPWTHFA